MLYHDAMRRRNKDKEAAGTGVGVEESKLRLAGARSSQALRTYVIPIPTFLSTYLLKICSFNSSQMTIHTTLLESCHG